MKKALKILSLCLMLALSVVFAVACGEAEKGFSVTIDNKISDKDVVMNVRYLTEKDGVPTPVDIESGKKYAEDTVVFVQVINNTERKVTVTAKNGDTVINSAIVSAKDEEPGRGGLYGLELKADMTLILDFAQETALITINDGAQEGNTDSAVNGFHAYDPEDFNLTDYSNGQEVVLGRKLKAYVFNWATPVHLVIIHNGETVVDKVYPVVTDMDGHDEFWDIVIAGNVVITTEVATIEDELFSEEMQGTWTTEDGEHTVIISANSVKIDGEEIDKADISVEDWSDYGEACYYYLNENYDYISALEGSYTYNNAALIKN